MFFLSSSKIKKKTETQTSPNIFIAFCSNLFNRVVNFFSYILLKIKSWWNAIFYKEKRKAPVTQANTTGAITFPIDRHVDYSDSYVPGLDRGIQFSHYHDAPIFPAYQEECSIHLDAVLHSAPSRVDFSTPKGANLACVLLNSDFLNLDVSDLSATSENALALIIYSLNAIKERLPEEDQDKIEQLLNKFQCAYNIELQTNAILDESATVDDFTQYTHIFKQNLIARLEHMETLYISSGWNGHPAGHNISLELTPYLNDHGILMVKGHIKNRGEGLQYHESFIKGAQIAYDPEIKLVGIPLYQLKNSPFFKNYLQLKLAARPKDKKSYMADDTIRPTMFSKDDFYNVFLPSWPGGLEYSKKPTPKIAQRGPTCIVKPLIDEITHLLGNQSGKLAKFYITMNSLKNFIEQDGITEENAHQILLILPKLSRRALKIHKEGILSEEDIIEVNHFSKAVKQKIHRIEKDRISKLKRQTSTLNIRVREIESYALQLPHIALMPEISRSRTGVKQATSSIAIFIDVETFISEQTNQMLTAKSQNSLITAANIALYSLRYLPNPSDDRVWTSIQRPVNLLKNICEMQQILFEATQTADQKYIMTPQQACVWGKVFGITYRLAQRSLPFDLCEYYANGLKNLMDNRLPALFCPFSPTDLDGYLDAINYVFKSINKRLHTTPCKEMNPRDENHGVRYSEIKVDTLREALNHPELHYLHSISKKHMAWKGRSPNLDFNELWGISEAYSFKAHSDQITPEYLAMRQSFFLLNLALDFRGESRHKYSHLKLNFSGCASSDSFYFRSEVYAMYQQNVSSYNQGVFADSFKAFTDDAENFAVDLLDKKHFKKGHSFNSHNDLALFQEAEVISGVSLSPLDIQDLLAARTRCSFPLAQIEHYFSENMSHLDHPFFQSIFMALLFKIEDATLKSPLISALEHSPCSREIDNFFAFLNVSLIQARNMRSWTIYFFLLRVSAISISYCLQYQGSAQITNDLIEAFERELDSVSSLFNLQKIPTVSQSSFNNCLLSIVPYFANFSNMIPIIHKFYSIRAKLTASQFDTAAIDNFQLQEDIAYGAFLLKNLPHLVATEERAKTISNLLPDWIVAHDTYRALFKINYPVQEMSPGYYEFLDEKGIRYRIYTPSINSIRIFRSFIEEVGQSAWYSFENETPFKQDGTNKEHPCSNEGGYFMLDSVCWFKVVGEKKARIVSRKTDETLSFVALDKICHPTLNGLILFKNYHNPVLTHIYKITSPKKVLAWKNSASKELLLIELKEFKMKFSQELRPNGRVVWNSSKHFGYYLDEHQKNVSFEPFSHYVVLTNDEGSQKIICPSRRYASDKIKVSRQVEKKAHSDTVERLFTYDIDVNGMIILPDDAISLIYLIHLAIEKQDYVFGFRVMKKLLQHPGEWDEVIIKLMQYFEIPNTDEIDKLNLQPPASALRLQLKASMLSSSTKKMDKNQMRSLVRDYFNYLNQLNSIQGLQRLDLEHERLLYDALVEMPFLQEEYFILRNRMQFLTEHSFEFPDGFELKKTEFMPEIPMVSLSANWDWLDLPMQNKITAALQNPTPIVFTMRPGIAFVKNVLFYYSILQEGKSEEKIEEIKELLKACQYDSDDRVQCVRALLLAVLSAPSAFPTCQTLFLELSASQRNEAMVTTSKLGMILTKLVESRGSVQELSSFDSCIENKRVLAACSSGISLEAISADERVTIRPEFDEIPDKLLDKLVKANMIYLCAPSQRDLEVLSNRLIQLKEIEAFYLLQSQQTEDSASSREIERLLDGVTLVIAEIEKQIIAIQLLLSTHDISRLTIDQEKINIFDDQVEFIIEMLNDEVNDDMLVLEELEQQILSLLQTYSIERVLEMHGELYRSLTVEEALVHFGREDDIPFYSANPDLSTEQLMLIKSSIGKYLLNKLNIQKCERLLDDFKTVNHIKKNLGIGSIDYAVAKTKAIQTLQATRKYIAHKAPHLLVFEVFANICLKEDQISALNALTSGDDSQNIIFEARTGFGKSKALIPLWLYLTGKKRKIEEVPGISMMTVPASLYQQQVTYLKRILGGAFNQSVFAFQFTREKGNNLLYLKNLNRSLEQAAAKGMCVLTTVNSLHSLVNLKLKECLTLENSFENKQLIKELRSLRYKAKHQLSNFFDESRECFDIRLYFDYAIGAPKKIPINYCHALELLYETILNLGVPFDFLPEMTECEQPPLSEEKYNQEIKEIVARRLLDHLIRHQVIPEPTEKFSQLLLKHFMGEFDSQIVQYLERIPESKKNIYAIFRNQLNIYLPRTLIRQCNGRYGLSPEKTGNRFAYPFERGIPKLSSQFSTIDDLLDFTIQANLKTPFSFNDISQFVARIKFKMEQAENKQDFKSSDNDYQCYLKITKSLSDWPASINNCREEDLIRLQKEINNSANLKLKLAFITGYILPKITLHTQKVSSTAHNLVEALDVTYGASGTINTDTLSPKLRTIEQLDTPIGSILSLWENSQDAIYILKEQKADRLLKSVVSGHHEIRVIIDVDNIFRDLRSEIEIARIVFENTIDFKSPSVDALSYYDENGENMVFMRPQNGEFIGPPVLRDHCTVPVDNVYIFMRQSATVGADTPMPMTANALVSVGSETQRDLFLQGVGRMRGLQRGQKVSFLIQEKDVSYFQHEGSITLSSILSMVSKNQGAQRGQDLFFNLRLLLQNLLEKQFWQYFDDSANDIDACIDVFQAMQSFFVENSFQNPFESLYQSRGIVAIHDAVQQIKDGFLRKLALVLENRILSEVIDAEVIIEEFDALLDFNKLPINIKMGSAEECEVEVESAELDHELAEVEYEVGSIELISEQDTEQAQESEREKATISALPYIPYKPAIALPSGNYHSFGIDISSSATKSFHDKFSPLLESFYGSTNYFRMSSAGERPKGILKTAYQYLIIYEKEKFKVVLMDQQDALKAMEKMMEENDPVSTTKDFYLMSSTGKVLSQNAQKKLNVQKWNSNPDLTILTKIFSRQLNFSGQEIRFLASLKYRQRKLYFDFFNQEISYCWPPLAGCLSSLQSRVEEMLLCSCDVFQEEKKDGNVTRLSLFKRPPAVMSLNCQETLLSCK